MNVGTGIVLYLIIWWTALFTVLPWGNTPDENPETGNITSAPALPRLKKKFLITTFISAVIWLIIYVLIKVDVFDLYEISRQMKIEDNL